LWQIAVSFLRHRVNGSGPMKINFLEKAGELIEGSTQNCTKIFNAIPFGIEEQCPKFVFTTGGEFYNKEDPFSHHYLDVREIKSILNFNWTLEKNLIPITDILPSNFGKADLSFSATVGFEGVINSIDQKLHYQDESHFKHVRNEFEFGGLGEFTASILIELFPNVENFGIKLNTKVASRITVRREIHDMPVRKVVNIIEWEPLLISGGGALELGFEFIDVSFEQVFFDKRTWSIEVPVKE